MTVKAESAKKIELAIFEDKLEGLSDVEIGKKYGITYRQLEKIIRNFTGVSVSAIRDKKKIKTLHPKDFKEETTTVWSFKNRGKWATHSGEYRGNWSPYIPRNVILKYSKPGDIVLDYFCGAGTTAVEAKLLGRKCIAFDINEKAIDLAKKNIDFPVTAEQLNILHKAEPLRVYEPELFVADARDLSFIASDSIDLICAHPPYSNAIRYTEGKEGDLSFYSTDEFLKEMTKVARESYRVLKPGRKCAILIGDVRRKKHVIPLGFKLIDVYLNAGFKLKELIIKRQHNCKTTGFWYEKSIKYNFLLLAHEYLLIFEKPETCQYIVSEKESYPQYYPPQKGARVKKSIKEIETTTVWILPEEDFEAVLNKNVIKRYSDSRNYLLVNSGFSLGKYQFLKKSGSEDYSLLFIKFIVQTFEHENFLKNLKGFVNKKIKKIKNNGYLVIQTKDIRIFGYIEPFAKRIVDLLENERLSLKEIIIVTKEKDSKFFRTEVSESLEIVHQYLLVYEVIK